MRTCTKCGKEYPATKQYFRAVNKTKLGLSSECKACLSDRYREWYEKNRERQREYYHEYYLKVRKSGGDETRRQLLERIGRLEEELKKVRDGQGTEYHQPVSRIP